MKKLLGLFAAIAMVASCTRGVILYEQSAVLVTARPPAPPPPRMVVKLDRIDVTDAIYFETNRSEIRADSLATLDEMARLLNDHPELLRIQIEGHTDSLGSASDNLALSKRRATQVRTYLIEQGVDARRLVSEGFGGEKPIADNTDRDGRAKNRRVVFTVLERADERDQPDKISTSEQDEGGAS